MAHEKFFHITARVDNTQYWWNGFAWDAAHQAETYNESAAERQANILRANNRFLDSEDQAQDIRLEGAN